MVAEMTTSHPNRRTAAPNVAEALASLHGPPRAAPPAPPPDITLALPGSGALVAEMAEVRAAVSQLRAQLGDVLTRLADVAADGRLSYKPAEAARLLGISDSTLLKATRAGELAPTPVAGVKLYARAELIAYLARQAQRADQPAGGEPASPPAHGLLDALAEELVGEMRERRESRAPRGRRGDNVVDLRTKSAKGGGR